jgi:hypothetical protein
MKRTMAIRAAGLAALACAGPLEAHHSGSMYDPTPVWVGGTVIRFESIDPHTITTLEERSADGALRRWAVEGPGRSQLDRMGIGMDVPQVGDVIEFCAFPYKSAAELSRIFPGVDFSVRRSSEDSDSSAPQFVWGHVMVTPGEEKRLWNPHGLLSECIRSSDDQRQSWLDFLNSSSSARQGWCQQRGYAHVRTSVSLSELVEEIDRSLDQPCD